jgi:hypothetical protein
MRDKNLLNPIQFSLRVEEFIKKRIPRKILDIRNQILNNPKLLEDFESNLKIHTRKSEEFLSLLFLSWYLPKEVGMLLQLEIIEKEKVFNEKDRIFYKLLLSSKEISQILIFQTKRWHTRDFFGNFLERGLKELERLHFKKRNFKLIPEKHFRGRGYQDHGSRRPDFKWLPSSDWSFTLKQNQKELKENKFQTKYLRILRYLEKLLKILE